MFVNIFKACLLLCLPQYYSRWNGNDMTIATINPHFILYKHFDSSSNFTEI